MLLILLGVCFNKVRQLESDSSGAPQQIGIELTGMIGADVSFTAPEIALQDKEVLKVKVNNANNGGLLSVIDGLPGFIPYSLVTKLHADSYMSVEVSPI